jgi:endonuclease/exonuclease/phosphatase family metal-dependent hydrolase
MTTRTAPGRLAVLALAGLLAGLAPARPQPPAEAKAPEAPPVRVGTWNIQWLGRPDKRFDGAQKADDLAEYVHRSGVAVLGLNEITADGEPAEPRTNRTLTEATRLLREKTGHTWKHVLFAKEDDADRDQLVGVAWDADRVKLVGAPFRVPLRRKGPSDEVWRRYPWAAKFSLGEGKTDVVVVPVHQKSNFGGDEPARRTRAEEARMLARSLAAVQTHFADDDVVILGDFNCLKKDEPALACYAAVGLRDLNGDEHQSWIASSQYPAAPFDRVLVPDDQPEFKECRLTVFKGHHLAGEKEFRRRCSDHYLVHVDVKVLADDD